MFHQLLVLAATIFAPMAATTPSQQVPLAASESEPVRGFNHNVTYCTVPRAEQLLNIAFFDVTPMPVPVYVFPQEPLKA